MTEASTVVNHQIRLAARPVGLPTRANWSFTTEPVPELADGDVLVQTRAHLSLDPAMRGWMNEGRSYIPPVGIGEVMRAGGVGRVVASRNAAFGVGDDVYAGLGVQEVALIRGDDVKRSGLARIDLRLGTATQLLNDAQMPGMTAYFGLLDVGQPQAERRSSSPAPQAPVGQTVGQLAKIKGCRAVGIARRTSQSASGWSGLGFDACIDYKAGSVRDGLKAHCPSGVDVYFDNVGGDILDTVLTRINRKARIVICGAISQYNATTPVVDRRTTCRCSSTARAWKAWSSTMPTAIRRPSPSWRAT